MKMRHLCVFFQLTIHCLVALGQSFPEDIQDPPSLHTAPPPWHGLGKPCSPLTPGLSICHPAISLSEVGFSWQIKKPKYARLDVGHQWLTMEESQMPPGVCFQATKANVGANFWRSPSSHIQWVLHLICCSSTGLVSALVTSHIFCLPKLSG